MIIVRLLGRLPTPTGPQADGDYERRCNTCGYILRHCTCLDHSPADQ